MKVWIVLAMAASLAACASRPVRTVLPPAQQQVAEEAQSAREAALRADTDWSLTGRIAVSTGRDGGSGRIEWRQSGDRYEVSLSAPVTRQSWRLSGDAAGAMLEGLDGGPRSGADAAAVLREATGWDVPIVALADWVRGARSGMPGPAVVSFDGAGRLSTIEQGGWTIAYAWPEATPGTVDAPALPARIDARRGEARVRLLIDDWGDADG